MHTVAIWKHLPVLFCPHENLLAGAAMDIEFPQVAGVAGEQVVPALKLVHVLITFPLDRGQEPFYRMMRLCMALGKSQLWEIEQSYAWAAQRSFRDSFAGYI